MSFHEILTVHVPDFDALRCYPHLVHIDNLTWLCYFIHTWDIEVERKDHSLVSGSIFW